MRKVEKYFSFPQLHLVSKDLLRIKKLLLERVLERYIPSQAMYSRSQTVKRHLISSGGFFSSLIQFLVKSGAWGMLCIEKNRRQGRAVNKIHARCRFYQKRYDVLCFSTIIHKISQYNVFCSKDVLHHLYFNYHIGNRVRTVWLLIRIKEFLFRALWRKKNIGHKKVLHDMHFRISGNYRTPLYVRVVVYGQRNGICR